jgi:hypothetical protein
MSNEKRVDGARVQAGAAFIGVEVSWSFGSGEHDAVKVPREDLEAVFNAEGAGACVEYLNVVDVLKRSINRTPTRKGMVIKPFARPNRDTPLSFGIYERVGTGGESGDTFVCRARVRAEKRGVIALPPEGEAVYASAEWQAIALDIEGRANQALTTACNEDISSALCDLGWRMGWLSRRRNQGGVYFILAQHCDRFVRVLDAIERLTADAHPNARFVPSVIEQYAAPRTMATWNDRARQTFEQEIATLAGELKRAREDGNVREKTLHKRFAACEDLMLKAEGYRLFLAEQTDALVGELGKLRDDFQRALDGELAEAGVLLEEATQVAEAPPRPAVPKAPPPEDELALFDL